MSLRHNLALLPAVSSLITVSTPAPSRPLGPALRAGDRREIEPGRLRSALTELRSCTNEIVLFFVNGVCYLTIGCCRAITVITRNCWPAMLVSLGFTAEEADILRGYHDAEIMATPPSVGERFSGYVRESRGVVVLVVASLLVSGLFVVLWIECFVQCCYGDVQVLTSSSV